MPKMRNGHKHEILEDILEAPVIPRISKVDLLECILVQKVDKLTSYGGCHARCRKGFRSDILSTAPSKCSEACADRARFSCATD
jgi:hypothetical protein